MWYINTNVWTSHSLVRVSSFEREFCCRFSSSHRDFVVSTAQHHPRWFIWIFLPHRDAITFFTAHTHTRILLFFFFHPDKHLFQRIRACPHGEKCDGIHSRNPEPFAHPKMTLDRSKYKKKTIFRPPSSWDSHRIPTSGIYYSSETFFWPSIDTGIIFSIECSIFLSPR